MRSPNSNPRSSHYRVKMRARMKAMDCPCGICKGRLGPIHYDEKSCPQNPLSFVIDEIIPVSKWKEYGYPSREAVALDSNNIQAAHYVCNASKGAKVSNEKKDFSRVSVVSAPW